MNLSPKWASFLIENGIETVHWSEIGAANSTDLDIATYAKANNMILMTSDLDFGRIAFSDSGSAPSVILLRVLDDRPLAIGGRVVTVVNGFKEELLAGAFLLLEDSRVRLRAYTQLP